MRNILNKLPLVSIIALLSACGDGGSESDSLVQPQSNSGIVISEFLASNDSGLADEDGGLSDWIELHNRSDAEIDLEGWYLTDDEEELDQWEVPALTVAPGEFVVVFASGKDRDSAAGQELHTNFKLSGGGEYLALVQADGATIADQYAPTYPSQAADVSYGHNPSGAVAFLESPTPGAENAEAVVAQVEFSRPAGVFSGTLSLQMSLVADGGRAGTIFYTTDGTEPTAASPRYASPVALTQSTLLRALAIDTNSQNGAGVESQAHYIAVDQTVAAARSDLALIVIDTLGIAVTGEDLDRASAMSVIERSGGKASLDSVAQYSGGTSIKIRGSSSSVFPKKQFKLELKDGQNNDQDEDLLGLGKESDWILYAPGRYDRNMISNPLMQKLAGEIGFNELESRFIELYINEDGGAVDAADYQGIYLLTETIKIGKNRVDIEKLSSDDNEEPDVTGGYILSVDRSDDDRYTFSTDALPNVTTDWTRSTGALNIVRPKLDKLTQTQRVWIETYVKNFEAALAGPNFADPVVGYQAYIDSDSWIDSHLLGIFSKEPDLTRYSHYMTKERDEKLRIDPLWDFDRAFNSTEPRFRDPQMLWDDDGTSYPFHAYWWDDLFDHPEFLTRYRNRWLELRAGPLATASVLENIDELSAEVATAYAREDMRWGADPEYGSRFTDYAGEVSALKTWVRTRLTFLDQELFKPIPE